MTTQEDKILDSLPIHSDGSEAENWHSLSIRGLVSKPLSLTAKDLSELPRQELTDDFRCGEGWIVPDQQWAGVTLRDVIGMSDPLPNSNYVLISAGDYSVGMSMYEVYTANNLLALDHNAKPLSAQHGGPCRLIGMGKQCYFSVKWVDRIDIMALEPAETAGEIAALRIANRD